VPALDGAVSGVLEEGARPREEEGDVLNRISSSGEIDDGRWEIDEALSAQVRDAIARRSGSVHSYTLFTGYFERRIRGEMESFQVLPDR
jgi:hypothetical protein